MVSKALLLCVLLATFCLLLMATAAAAPSMATPSVAAPLVANVSRSVSSAVQKRLLTEEAIALQEIARALNRSVKLLSSNWSWIKVQLGFLVVTILASYLVDLGRKRWSHWKSLRPSPLEDVFTPLTRQLLTELTALKVQLTAALDRMAITTACAWRQLEVYANEVTDLRAQLVAAMDRMSTTAADAWRQLEANANAVADLRAQLAAALDWMATKIADTERKEEETNRKFEWLEARFHSLNTNRKEYYHESLWPRVETELEREGKEGVIVAYGSRRAAGFLSD